MTRAVRATIVALALAAIASAAATLPGYSSTVLSRGADESTLVATLTSEFPSTDAYDRVSATVTTVTADVTRVVLDYDRARSTVRVEPPYRLPTEVFAPPPSDGTTTDDSKISAAIDRTTGAITLTDKASKQPLFSTEGLRFGPRVLNFTAAIGVDDKTYLSGYGEHDYYYFLNHEMLAKEADSVTLSLWNTDNGTPWKKPMYGVHPVVFVARPQLASFSAIVLMNSHAQQMKIDASGLRFFVIGGNLDAFVIRGATMLDVITQYHLLVTKPAYVPPYWSLGMQQCRWGYKNVSSLRAVVDGYAAAKLPLEVMWSDIDYMDKFRIFTTDPVHYPQDELRALINDLHNSGRKYVQIIDPGVAQANYSVYWDGLRNGAYVNTSDGHTPIVNVVWPGWTVFPDFTSDRVGLWWKRQLREYFANISVDGLWLDMNELGTFCNGGCPVGIDQPWTFPWLNANWTRLTTDICLGQGKCFIANSSLNNPDPSPQTNGWPLAKKTLDMTAKLAMGDYYDTKAFYGMMEEQQTYKAMRELRPETRPFILSRATFVGSGRFTSHWTGDNNATWEPKMGGIVDSVQGCLAANLWGVSQVGSDIGGFFGVPEQQLLSRWTQMGAFYTFMRNHHGLDTTPGSEPFRFPAAVPTIRTAIQWRYRLLPFIFTTLAESHYFGGPAMRHVSVNFPTDAAAYRETTAFMLGDSLLVIPIVTEDATSVEAYVPQGAWYRLRPDGADAAVTRGPGHFTFESAVYNDTIPVLVQAGTAIAMHTTPMMTVQETQQSGLSLLCLLDDHGAAYGTTYLDTTGSAPLPEKQGDAYRLDFACSANGAGGFVTASVPSRTASADGVPAGTGTVTVRALTAIPKTANFILDGESADHACEWSADSTTVTCALGARDASRPFRLTWGDRSQHGWAGGSPVTYNGDDSKMHISVAGFVFSLLGVAAVGVAATVFVFHRRARRHSSDAYREVQ